MTITISNLEFLQYHNNVYKNEDDKNNIREFVESKGSSFRVKDMHKDLSGSIPETSTEIYKEPQGTQGIELSNLVIDTDTLERHMACDDDDIEDENVKAYIESQKSHKLRFLKEVQERGLRTKHNDPNDNDKVVHLNY
ncbi:uncharacterized protein AC631_01108 [Debaryomyces fabryi]|uniref:Uncharacterized protein n=1 Tax=Debaryomyces fabryi TaxID=58627 RepID=A0A0V1Q3P3_9ASCO|nr:uncharacterized protein AC631_01108 [Debaryomyces fabryi]KSA03095.1 hypothetical protein AC631_01108 [Debaryomyces fabryi]CUM45973.1 unnamed protein product [Debaryomyces fabryi]